MDTLVKKLASSNKRKRRWIYICIVLGCFMAIALLSAERDELKKEADRFLTE